MDTNGANLWASYFFINLMKLIVNSTRYPLPHRRKSDFIRFYQKKSTLQDALLQLIGANNRNYSIILGVNVIPKNSKVRTSENGYAL